MEDNQQECNRNESVESLIVTNDENKNNNLETITKEEQNDSKNNDDIENLLDEMEFIRDDKEIQDYQLIQSNEKERIKQELNQQILENRRKHK